VLLQRSSSSGGVAVAEQARRVVVQSVGVSCLRVCDCVPCRLKVFCFGGRRMRGLPDKYEGTDCREARLVMREVSLRAQADKGLPCGRLAYRAEDRPAQAGH
jgi:hypothetical protein